MIAALTVGAGRFGGTVTEESLAGLSGRLPIVVAVL
jgi:hypothetical protein